jgi:hypothetical protein
MAVPGVPTASQNAKAPTVQTVPILPLGAEEEGNRPLVFAICVAAEQRLIEHSLQTISFSLA